MITEPRDLQVLIMGSIKRIWRRHPNRTEVLKRVEVRKSQVNKDGSIAKREQVFYKCEACSQLAKTQGNDEYPQVDIDHIEPVIPIDRPLESWNEFIVRLFCSPDNLSALCRPCHLTKSKAENAKRRLYTKAAKVR